MATYKGNWDKIREQVLERDGHTCKSCGIQPWRDVESTVTLHVHHKEKFKTSGQHRLEDLITLCSKCHGRFEIMSSGTAADFDKTLEWRKGLDRFYEHTGQSRKSCTLCGSSYVSQSGKFVDKRNGKQVAASKLYTLGTDDWAHIVHTCDRCKRALYFKFKGVSGAAPPPLKDEQPSAGAEEE